MFDIGRDELQERAAVIARKCIGGLAVYLDVKRGAVGGAADLLCQSSPAKRQLDFVAGLFPVCAQLGKAPMV